MDQRRLRVDIETDVCDPVGCVLEGRVPARVLRRRCRSEGVDRSPYEDASREHYDIFYGNRALPNRNQFTINSVDRFRNECLLPTAENGDYFMATDQRYHRYQPIRTKLKNASRPITVSTLANGKLDDRLPKVEELFEKTDQEMMEVAVAKQPLKPILNNPSSKSPPHGILKKPKSKASDKTSIEGRRRQRASSESDNTFCSFQLSTPVERPPYVNGSAMKRAKDNSGYSYGTAIASLNYGPIKTHYHQSRSMNAAARDKTSLASQNGVDGHILRTTKINDKRVEVTEQIVENARQETPAPTCPAISPSLPVSSVTTLPVAKKVVKKKVKPPAKSPSGKRKASFKADDEPDPWQMDTDAILAEVARIEASSPNSLTPTKPAPKKKPQNAEPIPPPPNIRDAPKVEILDAKNLNNVPEVKVNGSLEVKEPRSPTKETPIPIAELHCLRASLFPRVPPYLKFISHDDSPSLKIPIAIQKHLKWKMTTITPIVVKKTLMNSGFRLVKSECDTSECPQEETVEWIGIWGKHMKSIMFRAIKDGQKMNHFPGTFQIGRKDRLWRNLQKLSNRYGAKEFGIMPKTYVLPHDMKILKHDWEKHSANNEKWIIKPPASARGTGIKVVSKWTQIPKKRPVVVQRYVSKPYLINGNKFDMRLYVLVTSIHPLRIYLYKDGLARFASVKYNDEIASLNDRYMHLTNYSINRLSKNYTPNEDFAACEGHKWTLQTLFQYLRNEKQIDTDALWEDLKDLVIKTIISGEGSISSLTKANVTSRYNCYELFGIDVLLDEELKPWLLEVNISPSLHSASPLDIHVKGPLVTTVLNIAQFQVPNKINLDALNKEKPNKFRGLPYDSRLYTVYLSKEERDKHIIYTNMEERDMYLRDILSTLTPDDVRHLIQAEDELTQSGEMERVFPTKQTHKYLVFLNGARYYNRLFDAWESRYGNNRNPGLELLRNLCDIGYHLEVPQVPLKNDVDAPSPVPSVASAVPSAAPSEGRPPEVKSEVRSEA